jgi:hypothetical protein
MPYFAEPRIMLRMSLIIARLSFVVGLVAMAIPVGALAQKASSREMACHAEATKRYIEDFRQVGPIHEETYERVVVFVNDKLKYEAYYVECLGRWNSIKVR